MLAVPTVPVSDFAMYRESAELPVRVRAPRSRVHLHARVRRAARLGEGRGRRPGRAEDAGRVFGGIGAARPVRHRAQLLDRRALDRRAGAAARLAACLPVPSRRRGGLLSRSGPRASRCRASSGPTCRRRALLALALALLVTLGPRAAVRARRSRSARRWGSAPGSARWRCRCRRWPSATGWRARREDSPGGGAHRGRRGGDAARAAPLGYPPRAPERLALLHRRSRRHHRAHRREPQLGGDVHARAEPHVQGRHRPQRARRAAPRDRPRRLRHRARVVSVRAAATRSASRR